MINHRVGMASVLGLAIVGLLVGCAGKNAPGDATASVSLAITTVPADVSCIEVTVTSTQTTRQLFDVTPGQAATITVQGLTSGPASINERAFGVPCAQVQATTPPTWVAVMPVSVDLVPGTTVDVAIVLRRAGQVRITNDFQDGSAASFTLTPSSLNFGSVNVGGSQILGVTVTNTGSAASVPPALSIPLQPTDPQPQFAIVGGGAADPNACSPTVQIPVGAGCNLQVSFAPTSPGTKTATLVSGSGGTGVSLTGIGVAAGGGGLTFVPSALDFGNVNVGASANQLVNVSNGGAANITVPAFTIQVSPTDPQPQFSILGGDPNACNATTVLMPGALCTLRIAFSPTSAGLKTSSLTGPAGNGVSLMGTGVAAGGGGLTFVPSALNFGNVNVGASANQLVNVSNGGAANITVPAFTIQVSPTDPQPQFSILGGDPNACNATTVLMPGALCTLRIAFSPTSAGLKTSSLTGPAGNGVSLMGTGVAAGGGGLTFVPSALNFGNVNVGASANQLVNVSNGGAANITVPAFTIQVSPTDPQPQFSILGGDPNACNATTVLMPGALCTLRIAFSPTSAGLKTSSLTGPAGNGVSLMGTGVAAGGGVLSFSPTALAFGNVNVGVTSPSQTVTVTNTGTAAIAPPAFSIPISPTDPAPQFNIVAGGATACATFPTIAVGASCTIQINFAPTSAGPKNATLNTPTGSPVALSGTGVATMGVLSFSPTALAFGNVNVGVTSPSQTVTVTNAGTAAIAPPAFSIPISPTDPAPQFNIVAGGATACATFPTIAVGASCTIQINFAPTSAGPKNATLNTPTGSPVALSGTGVATTPAFSATPTTLPFGNLLTGNTTGALMTVTIRNTGTATITTPARAITGTNPTQFSIPTGTTGGTCSTTASLAANATCTVALRFTPTTTGAKTATLTIGTAPMTVTVALSGTGT